MGDICVKRGYLEVVYIKEGELETMYVLRGNICVKRGHCYIPSPHT